MATVNPLSPLASLFHGLSAIVISLLALVSYAVAAEESDPDTSRWYQVEVLIFAHKNEQSSSELWRDDIALAYPLNWVVLKDPDVLVPLVEEQSETANTEIEQFEIENPAAEKPHSALAADISAGPSQLASDVADTPFDSEAETMVAPPVDLEREPFYLLPPEQRDLEAQASAIRRSYPYRLLFHAGWRQPVVDADEAASILISGGNRFGEHFELEGSISLSVSRYLHLRTNLWYTRFVNNYGQDRGDWPQLPVRPDLREYVSPPTHSWGETSEPLWERFQPLNDEYDKILESPYIPKRISLIQQRRRMKSQEIHYIDHPHIGIVILCTPYELPPEEKPEEALSETAIKTPAPQ